MSNEAFTSADLLKFMRLHRLAVESSVSTSDGAQAAMVGIAVTDAFEIVFDTVDTTRKVANLRSNPRIAFVIGGGSLEDPRTVQYEGIADEPGGEERERIKAEYLEVWPDGRAREAWKGLVYVRVRPTWIRYSDFTSDPPLILEFDTRVLSGSHPA